MSIRLRLTLIYSAILALTLVAFSVTLYVTQARTVLSDTKKELAGRADYFIDKTTAHWSRDHHPTPGDARVSPGGHGPIRLPRSRIGTFVQVRTLDGNLLDQSPNLGDSFTLPLSEQCTTAVANGQTWVETGTIEDERLLVHNQPFTLPGDDSPLIMQVAVSLADQDQNLATLSRILVAGSSVAVVAAFGIGWLLAGLTLRPINRLRQTAQAIGEERNFGRRVDYSGPNDEVGQLATTFNEMLTELQAAYVQVEETLQAQRRFVADASHELRTPLTTLRGNIGLLQRQPPIRSDDQADVLLDMVDETERLMRLVNELLILARADAGRPLRQQTVPVDSLLADVCQQVRLLAPRRKITRRSSSPAASISGDSDALKQILLALLDNALSYTPDSAAITLDSIVDNGHVTIQVRDDGPGIAPEHLPHIFERFYRGDAARTSDGTGLGLAIASELTQAQQGSITVDSRPGQGSTFTLTFPHASPRTGNGRA